MKTTVAALFKKFYIAFFSKSQGNSAAIHFFDINLACGMNIMAAEELHLQSSLNYDLCLPDVSVPFMSLRAHLYTQ